MVKLLRFKRSGRKAILLLGLDWVVKAVGRLKTKVLAVCQNQLQQFSDPCRLPKIYKIICRKVDVFPEKVPTYK